MTRRPDQTDGAYRHAPPADSLPCDCWCRYRTVMVPRTDILAGLTRPCGLTACNTADTDHRTPGGTS